jgi:uncharacterized protein (DUF302 family)
MRYKICERRKTTKHCKKEFPAMTRRQIEVQRFSITSSKSFGEVAEVVDAAISHPDMKTFRKNIEAAKSFADVETVVHEAIGPSDFMEFIRFDLGAILKKDHGERAPRSVRLVLGNPLIMKRMVEQVPDAGSYAPVTILIDERADGVCLSYDRMASFLASYGSEEALQVSRELDAKVERLLTAAK